MRQKRRPTLEELKELPEEAWRLEAIQLREDAKDAAAWDIAAEASDLFFDQRITPERVLELREKLEATPAVELAV